MTEPRTQLQISLQQPEARGVITAGAIASVRLLTGLDGQSVKRWWSDDKPVAIVGNDISLAPPTVFDLPTGGIYEIEITRPRGPAISREYRIEEQTTHPDTIMLEASPHEYLAWHQYAGTVRSDPYTRQRAHRGSAMKSLRMDKLMLKSQAKIDSLYSNVRAVPKVFAAEVPGSRKAWQMVTDASRSGLRGWATATLLEHHKPSSDNEYAAWFLGAPTRNEGKHLISRLKQADPPDDVTGNKYPRWMTFDTGGQIDLVSVPWPWWGARIKRSEEIQVVYDRIRPSAVDRKQPGRLSISVLDSRWFGMLEFLASGRLNRSEKIFEQSFDKEHPDGLFDPDLAVYGKVKGPLVATAGAIVLIAGAQSTEKQYWDPWIRNLSRWFPGIPDGPILLGCRLITRATSQDGLDKAFAHIREGVERGIPFFSATIRMLSMSLSQIGGDVIEADALRRFIAPVSSLVDPDQVFTVIRL